MDENDFTPKGAFQGWVKAKISMLCLEIKDIKSNHLISIYKKLDESGKKPSWFVAILLTILFSLCSSLIVGILMVVLRK